MYTLWIFTHRYSLHCRATSEVQRARILQHLQHVARAKDPLCLPNWLQWKRNPVHTYVQYHKLNYICTARKNFRILIYILSYKWKECNICVFLKCVTITNSIQDSLSENAHLNTTVLISSRSRTRQRELSHIKIGRGQRKWAWPTFTIYCNLLLFVQ